MLEFSFRIFRISLLNYLTICVTFKCIISYYPSTFIVFHQASAYLQPIQIPLATGEDINSTESDGDSWRLCHALSSSGLLQLLAFWDLKLLASSDPRVFARRSQVFAISQPGKVLLCFLI